MYKKGKINKKLILYFFCIWRTKRTVKFYYNLKPEQHIQQEKLNLQHYDTSLYFSTVMFLF